MPKADRSAPGPLPIAAIRSVDNALRPEFADGKHIGSDHTLRLESLRLASTLGITTPDRLMQVAADLYEFIVNGKPAKG